MPQTVMVSGSYNFIYAINTNPVTTKKTSPVHGHHIRV